MTRCAHLYGDPTRGLPFFPEYTSHGVDHINDVLAASSQLITEESQKHLTSEDFAVLVLAVLLHDAGMHLTEDGFLSLIGQQRKPVCDELDTEGWPQLWARFYDDASRWDESTLHKILGDDSKDSRDLIRLVTPVDQMGPPNNWTTAYRRFIGEFIRRHHARMAHEFAILGFPGPSHADAYNLIPPDAGDYANIAGLIARSHNMPLRATFRYLNTMYSGHVECLNTRPVYLMTLLRVADFLQVDNSRTPLASVAVRTIRNPLSAAEWATHLAVQEVRQDHSDPESLFILARPPNIDVYSKLEKLLRGLQDELDTSWAVLGEVYGRRYGTQGLGIAIRRVHSNIDDSAAFRKRVHYIPRRFAFRSSGTTLLKKLVSPLYGERPEVGIRELLQNAIDAVREFCALTSVAERAVPPIKIAIEKDAEGNASFCIEDCGVGMTEDILADYYFTVGASFRESDAWKRSFLKGSSPAVIRSGRFGVGALAAFLLGDAIQVTTRHYTKAPNEALTFKAHISDETIQVEKCEREVAGTTIRVELSATVFERLTSKSCRDWDWYRWTSPAICRQVNNNELTQCLTRVPEPNDALPPQWHRISSTTFQDIIWTYSRAPHLILNGLNVGVSAGSSGYSRHMQWEGETKSKSARHHPVKVPSVSVTDKLGVFPVDLQRFAIISHKYPFADDLLADVARDYVAYCLAFAPTSHHPFEASRPHSQKRDYPGKADYPDISISFPCQFFFGAPGVGVHHPVGLSSFPASRAKLLLNRAYPTPFPTLPVSEGEAAFYGYVDDGHRTNLPMAICHAFGRTVENIGTHSRFYNGGGRIAMAIQSDLAKQLLGKRLGQFDLSDLHVTSANDLPMTVVTNFVPDAAVRWELPAAVRSGVLSSQFIYVEIDEPTTHRTKSGVFEAVWNTYMTNALIPYSHDTRKHTFPRAYDELSGYIENWTDIRSWDMKRFDDVFRRTTIHGFNIEM